VEHIRDSFRMNTVTETFSKKIDIFLPIFAKHGLMGSRAHGGSVAHGAHWAHWAHWAHRLSGTWDPRHLSPQALGHTCTWTLVFSGSPAIGLSGQCSGHSGSQVLGLICSWAHGLIGLSGSWAHKLICLTSAASNFGSVKLGLVKLL
jgi:hypothetical protein